jgi:hypothetical protein
MSTPIEQQVARRKRQQLAAARIKAAEVAAPKAKLQRSYATITAPAAGMAPPTAHAVNR